MKEQREQANAVTYGCMINACVKCTQTASRPLILVLRVLYVLGPHFDSSLFSTSSLKGPLPMHCVCFSGMIFARNLRFCWQNGRNC